MSDIFKPTDKDLLLKVKAIQKGIKAYPDGIIGAQTIDCLYRKFANVKYPYEEKFFRGTVIYANNIGVDYCQNRKSVSNIPYSISGVFQWGGKAISVLVSEGKVINNFSSHAWLKQPETIIYKTHHGVIGAIRAISIPYDLISDVEWAISGVGLHNYSPAEEGFKGVYSDVLRNTGHTGIGITEEGQIALLYKKCNGPQFKDWAINKLGLKYAIMLDGGHIGAINTPKYKYNLSQKQNNIIYAK